VLPDVGFCLRDAVGNSTSVTLTVARNGVPSVSKSLYDAPALFRYAAKN
jgi:hypothetical protein